MATSLGRVCALAPQVETRHHRGRADLENGKGEESFGTGPDKPPGSVQRNMGLPIDHLLSLLSPALNGSQNLKVILTATLSLAGG